MPKMRGPAIGALIIRMGFWGILYCNYNKEPLKRCRELFRPLYYPRLGLRLRVKGLGLTDPESPIPLIKEYSLNHIRDPTMT